MNAAYEWLNKKRLRTVDNIRLWAENPRLDPADSYITLKDFASEMTSTPAERSDFIRLAKSIALYGFVPADPVVVWKNPENNNFYVAEGNRRIVALKLLRNPQKAPKSIKGIFLKLAASIPIDSIEKIYVCIAPSFEDAEWYISQRNSLSSLQRPWTREQQFRWIADLYKKYDGNIEIVKEKTGLTESEIEDDLRKIKLKELIIEAKNLIPENIYTQAASIQFPISTFERFITNKSVRKAWGINFSGVDVILTKDKKSFFKAYAELIQRMYLPSEHKNYIDSRRINRSEKIEELLKSFPKVIEKSTTEEESEDKPQQEPPSSSPDEKEKTPSKKPSQTKPSKNFLKNNPYRTRLLLPIYTLKTDSYRLHNMFNEFQKIPLKLYPNSVAASIRIFLDLAVRNYIETEELEKDICKKHKMAIRDITLKSKLEFIRTRASKTNPITKILQKFLNSSNEFSLDVLNGYIHGPETPFLTYSFLNKFWDFLFPLFEEFLEIEEKVN